MEFMNFKPHRTMHGRSHAGALEKALCCWPVYHKYRLKGTFIETLRQSISQSVQSYCTINKLASLQELAGHTMYLANLQSSKRTLESQQSRSERKNAHNLDALNIMYVEPASSFESLGDFFNDRTTGGLRRSRCQLFWNGWLLYPSNHRHT